MFIEFVTRSWCTFFSLFPLKPVFYKVQLVHVQKASWKVTYKSNKCRSLNHTPFQSVSNIFSSLKIHLSPNIPLFEKKPEKLRQRISPTLTPNQNLLLRFFFNIHKSHHNSRKSSNSSHKTCMLRKMHNTVRARGKNNVRIINNMRKDN